MTASIDRELNRLERRFRRALRRQRRAEKRSALPETFAAPKVADSISTGVSKLKHNHGRPGRPGSLPQQRCSCGYEMASRTQCFQGALYSCVHINEPCPEGYGFCTYIGACECGCH